MNSCHICHHSKEQHECRGVLVDVPWYNICWECRKESEEWPNILNEVDQEYITKVYHSFIGNLEYLEYKYEKSL